MGVRDHALIVGIRKYPALTDLDGPEYDAEQFSSWLQSDARIQVPPAQITVLRSSDYPNVPSPTDRHPMVADVDAALEAHILRADQQGGDAGDRLYLYFAGHGMAPHSDEVALLMANAGRLRTGHHLPGRRYARWFREAAMFREIVLIMDCCREPSLRSPPRNPPWEDQFVQRPTSYAYGFATTWPSSAREAAPRPGEQVRGLFTQVLLEGLQGGIAPNAQGEVTISMLEGYVTDRFRSIFEAGLTPAAERQTPQFESLPKDTFVLLRGAARPTSTSTVHLRRGDRGPAVEIRVFDSTAREIPGQARDGELECALPRGFYKATAPGKELLFEVEHEGGAIDVVIG